MFKKAIIRILAITFIMFIAIFLFNNKQAKADIYYDNISLESDTWTMASSTHVVLGTVIVHGTLTIEPGAIVKFGDDAVLEIRGSLIAEGTPSRKIIFTSYKDDSYNGDTNNDGNATLPATRDWTSIYIPTIHGSGHMKNTVVKYANIIDVRTSEFSIEDSLIQNNYVGFYCYGTYEPLSIKNNEFLDNNYGIYSNVAKFILENNTISGGINSVYAVNSNDSVILNNTFSNTSDWPVVLEANSINIQFEDNNYQTNKKGIFIKSGSIGMDTILGADAPYAIDNIEKDGIKGLSIARNQTLSFEPGAIIKFSPGASLIADARYTVGSSLIASGTPESPVVFTSLYDDEYGGDTNGDGNVTTPAKRDWEKIHIKRYSTGHIDNAIIKYSTQTEVRTWLFTMENSQVEENYYGIAIADTSTNQNNSVIIKNNTFLNNDHGLHIWRSDVVLEGNIISGGEQPVYAFKAEQSSISNNTFLNAPDWPIVLEASAVNIQFEDNNYQTDKKGIFVKSGAIEKDSTMRADVPYVIDNIEKDGIKGLSIASDLALHLNPGAIIKFSPGASLVASEYFQVGSSLIASGTPESPIVFTSLYDDEYGGDTNGDGNATTPSKRDWEKINIKPDSTGYMKNTIIKYGTQIDIRTWLFTMENSQVEENYYGIFIANTSINPNDPVSIKNNTFLNNDYGFYAWQSDVVFEGNTVAGNEHGVYVYRGSPNIYLNNFIDNVIADITVEQTTTINLSTIDEYSYLYNGNRHRSRLGNYWSNYAGIDNNSNGIGDTPFATTTATDNFPLMMTIDNYTDLSTSTPPEKNPVIIVPGIIASYLHDWDTNEEIWPNILSMLGVDDEYLNDLILPNNGIPHELDIYPDDIFRSIVGKDFFRGLIIELKNNGYVEGEDLFVFPYDWRLDIDYLSGHGAGDDPNTLANKIQSVINQTNTQKVDIIAHSMGGLIVKNYAKIFDTSLINKFIDIATPHLGAPKAFKILMYGDNLGFVKNKFGFEVGLNQKRIQIISQNFPSIYQLLPSRNYFNIDDLDYKSYIADIYDLDNNNIKYNLDYDQSVEFMENTGRNEYLLGFNDVLHNEIDNYSPQSQGVDTYNIVGCGNPTIGRIYVLNKEKSGGYEYGLKYINGDSTVPLKSAEHLIATSTYYSNETAHAYLPSANGIRQLIASILEDTQQGFSFSDYGSLSQTDNICSFSGTQISYHSPIEIHVYDQDNNHAGPTENKDIEINIPGVQYDIIENNKFIFLPEGREYRIEGLATGIGSFNSRVQEIQNSQYIKTMYYNEIPLTSTSTNVQMQIADNQEEYIMQVDQDGDGVFEEQKEPDSILSGDEIDDMIKPETIISITGEQDENNNYILEAEIELTASDTAQASSTASGVLKTEYSLDNKETWINYQEPFTITTLGTTTIYYSSTDKAGNREEDKQETVVITEEIEITIDTTIQDIEKAYQDGDITKKWVKNRLIFRLNLLQKFINRCGDKRICKRIIKIRYKIILRSLNFYHKRGWVNNPGYGIIKEDINWLIDNIWKGGENE